MDSWKKWAILGYGSNEGWWWWIRREGTKVLWLGGRAHADTQAERSTNAPSRPIWVRESKHGHPACATGAMSVSVYRVARQELFWSGSCHRGTQPEYDRSSNAISCLVLLCAVESFLGAQPCQWAWELPTPLAESFTCWTIVDSELLWILIFRV